MLLKYAAGFSWRLHEMRAKMLQGTQSMQGTQGAQGMQGTQTMQGTQSMQGTQPPPSAPSASESC